MLSFSRTCLLSDNQLVNFVARHAVWYGRMRSPFSKNAFHCCQWYGVALEDLWVVSPAYILKLLKLLMTSIKSVLCVRFSSLFLFVLVISNLVTRAIVHVFLHAKLRLFFSFFVLVKFYSLIVCYMCVPCVRFL